MFFGKERLGVINIPLAYIPPGGFGGFGGKAPEQSDYSWAYPAYSELKADGSFSDKAIENILNQLAAETGMGRGLNEWNKSGQWRGRGYVHLTGKYNYEKIEAMTGLPITRDPGLLSRDIHAAAAVVPAYFKFKAAQKGFKMSDYDDERFVYRALAPGKETIDDVTYTSTFEKRQERMAFSQWTRPDLSIFQQDRAEFADYEIESGRRKGIADEARRAEVERKMKAEAAAKKKAEEDAKKNPPAPKPTAPKAPAPKPLFNPPR